mmetsp:Transcript_19279/g.29253  ORF Transcript_19279/g.29253 Transcript_19279/m.29253 type:complete len:102 (-) Transcript_19279:90-395(-)
MCCMMTARVNSKSSSLDLADLPAILTSFSLAKLMLLDATSPLHGVLAGENAEMIAGDAVSNTTMVNWMNDFIPEYEIMIKLNCCIFWQGWRLEELQLRRGK